MPHRRATGLVVGEERIFGDEFDQLWQRVRPGLPFAQVRDARYLNWRYRRNPFPFRLLAARDAGTLQGYLVLLNPPAEDGSSQRRAYIADWLFPVEAGPRVGRALVNAAINAALDEGVDTLIGQSARRSPLPLPWPKWITLQRKVGRPVIVHKSPAGEALLADRQPWHFTLSDNDSY